MSALTGVLPLAPAVGEADRPSKCQWLVMALSPYSVCYSKSSTAYGVPKQDVSVGNCAPTSGGATSEPSMRELSCVDRCVREERPHRRLPSAMRESPMKGYG